MKIEYKEILNDTDLKFIKYILKELLTDGLDIETLFDDMYSKDSSEYKQAYSKLLNFLEIEESNYF